MSFLLRRLKATINQDCQLLPISSSNTRDITGAFISWSGWVEIAYISRSLQVARQ